MCKYTLNGQPVKSGMWISRGSDDIPPRHIRPGLEASEDGRSIVEGPNNYQGIRKILARLQHWLSKI